MQHCSKDGREEINISFSKDEVEKYKSLVQLNDQQDVVPTLYLAKIWPKFKLFNQFISKEIMLRETEVLKKQEMKMDTIYKATLIKEEVKQVKKYKIHKFKLVISYNDDVVVTIKQTFIEM